MDPAAPLISILHLEDDPLDSELLQAQLEAGGNRFRFLRVDQRDEFLHALESEQVDIILADYNLPGFSGLQALKLAREKFSGVPFIFVSGALGEELAVDLLKSGATDYVLKDNLSRLESVVKRAIRERAIRDRQSRAEEEARRAREEAEKANAAKSRFLGRMSHELRTPLNAILGYTQLVQADPMTGEQQHCTAQIIKAGQHLLSLINEVLDISRIESGQMQLRSEAVEIVSIIQQAVDLMEPMARERGVTIRVLSAGSNAKPVFVQGDADRVAQVMINLVSNAVKYNIENGSVEIECLDTGNQVKILVRDTGVGIAAEKLERLFVPFDRLDAERSTTAQGTGLGLAVSKGLVEAMHGAIGVENASSGGCTFRISLPKADVRAVDETFGVTGGESWQSWVPPERVRNVLLVEDTPVNADFMTRVFHRRTDFCLSAVATAGQALDFLAAQTPDLLIVDLNLPDMRGEELIRKVRETHPGIPVLVITAEASEDSGRKSREAGADAFLTKPVMIGPMFQLIDDLLDSAGR